MTDIELKFYEPQTDEVCKTYIAPRVKTKVLKHGIRLAKQIGNPKNMDEAQVDALLDFVVELFGEQFTREELEEQTDLLECISVMQALFGRVNLLAMTQRPQTPNPTKPPTTQYQQRR